MTNKDRLVVIDLFCGAGGFSNGFERAGFDVKFGIDVDDDALHTFRKNHDAETINHDIRDGVPDTVLQDEFDIVFGSPPCKGFSDARGSRYLEDDRNGLVFEYIHWVSEIQPDVAVMENVTGMRTIGGDFIDGVQREFGEAGYDDVVIEELNSADFGVPQKRKRVILIATHKDTDFEPSFPPENNELESPSESKCLGAMISQTTVAEAFKDLGDVTGDGISRPDYSAVDMTTAYSRYVRNLDEGESLHNHTAKQVTGDSTGQTILDNLEPGEMYRSTRFGDRYRQVWDLLGDEFTDVENDAMEFIGNNRSKKAYRIKGKSVGHVDVCKIEEELPYDEPNVRNALSGLVDSGWLRRDTADGRVGFDLNTKSGVRPRYMRLQPDSQSNTILTTDFKPRDKAHPTENRGLSLREGARIQSFPDSFEFTGSFQNVASQIGNAVPPLMAYRIAEQIRKQMNSP